MHDDNSARSAWGIIMLPESFGRREPPRYNDRHGPPRLDMDVTMCWQLPSARARFSRSRSPPLRHRGHGTTAAAEHHRAITIHILEEGLTHIRMTATIHRAFRMIFAGAPAV